MKTIAICAMVVLGAIVLVLITGCKLLNSPPVAHFAYDKPSIASPLTVSFNASSSYDSDGSIVSYQWDFGDGSKGTGIATTHSYETTTTSFYQIALTITDDGGAQATISRVITVMPNALPRARCSATIVPGGPIYYVLFDGAASYDPDGSIVSYAWDYGDGQSGSGVKTTHAYSHEGPYTVRLTVTDNEGACGTITQYIGVGSPTYWSSSIDVKITAVEYNVSILGYEIEPDSVGCAGETARLVAQAKNVSGHHLDSVTISARAWDESGTLIDILRYRVHDVSPGEVFEFTLYVFDLGSVRTIELYDIASY
ncbi:MAG: PKD domain-containing protein [Nitrospiraceae bacterium]|nr:PKD domain-containing protein [Nitrospiraceae bacterium]